MLNPILYTEKVLSDFLKYQLTTYPFTDPDLYQQMRQLLSLEHTRQTPLFKGPYISLSRIFQEGATVAKLVEEKILHPHLQNLIPYPTLYGHQETAIRAIQNHQPTLVSTGTGSGKTECFLYPIISHCLELKDRQEPEGITAVIVYPMNALAEDQLGRLRELLAGTGISFGMYVGKTPQKRTDVSESDRLPPRSSASDYRKRVEKVQRKKQSQTIYPPEERVSRQEMRDKPPRILLTNIKQLELLLTRQQDGELFHNVQLQYLVFDEAHTFSGAIGAETACLIRRLKTFCQYQNPDKNREPICIATSATIADPEKGKAAGAEFAARFFGVDAQTVALVSEEYQEDTWQNVRTIPPALGEKAHAYLKSALEILDTVEKNPDTVGKILKDLLRETAGYQIAIAHWQESLYHYLTANELVYQLAKILTTPKSLDELIQQLQQRLDRPVNEPEILFWLALGAASRCQQRPLLRPVIHGFVRGVGGAVVTFPKDGDRGKLWLSNEDVDQTSENTLYRLPITSCSTCGQHYYVHHVSDFRFLDNDPLPQGGRARGTRQDWEPLSEERGGQRILLVDRLITTDEDDNLADHPDTTALTYFCRHCGTLHSSPLQRGADSDQHRCDHCGALGDLVVLQVIRQKEQNRGKLHRCIACRSQGRSLFGGFREPNKPIRATTVSDVHVLAQNLIHHAERRRLLIFADNRQDAAFQAGWMQDHARRFRLRSLMNQKIQESGGISIGDLTAHLDRLLDAADNELSESLAPEVWQVARKEAEGTLHNEERKYFLRIQVLREITTGLKQRFGLEPWGRLKVEYPALTPELPFIQNWSALTGITPPDLCNGIAALLDVTRRNNILLDKEGWIYSKKWQEGDREIQRGYMPLPQGVPNGLRLTKNGEDHPTRVKQWLSESGLTGVMNCCQKWGIDLELRAQFLTELWELLTDHLQLLHPITLTYSPSNRAIRGCNGVYQLDSDRLKLTPHQGLYRCQTCRRTHLRPTPNMTCMAYRCTGTLLYESEDTDSYDLMVLDQEFSMLRPREHSAQVPTGDREIIENIFRNERNERINTLVCTPTLEMGVNIGALDAVLMRNVPPLPANYWQRAGRAGRQHRMAVNLTYCRGASHDRAYFHEPLKLLNGTINPPKFNLRNGVMLAKHIHAAILTALQQLASSSGVSASDAQELKEIIQICFPTQIKSYLFDQEGNIRLQPLSVEPLRSLIQKHQNFIETYINHVFHQDPILRGLINPEKITECIDTTTDDLVEVIRRIWRRLQWAIAELDRLDQIRRRKGTLNFEEDETYRRCDRLIKQLKGQQTRKQKEAEGFDETNTYGVLAAEGFLPGYGLDTGSIKGTFLTPRTIRLRNFELNRPLATALREYVPGNMIYANSHRFFARNYQIDAESQFIPFQIDLQNEVVTEIPSAVGLNSGNVIGIPLNNVDLRHQSQISDDESYRFQLAVSILGYEQSRHDGGLSYHWGNKNLLLKRGNHLRLVNIGPSKQVNEGNLGYPFCRNCGQTRSPFASPTELSSFRIDHQDRCGQEPQNLAFYADSVVDTLIIQDCPNREAAYSLAETIRMGAAQILEMEIDDLQIITFGQAGQETVDVALYDPMPGGSGLLEQILEAWIDIISQSLAIAHNCPAKCTEACIDCLKTYRNAFYHRYLNRHTALQMLQELGSNLNYAHEIPPKLPQKSSTSKAQPVNNAEATLQELLLRAGFPKPIAQHSISLGRPLGTTTPDFFYEDPENDLDGICIYLDGLSEPIHGNPDRQRIDQAIRDELENRNYVVIRIAASELTDQKKMAQYFSRIAREVLGKNQAKALKEDQSWYQYPECD